MSASTYVWAAVADLIFLIAGFAVVRRIGPNPTGAGLVAATVLGPCMLLGMLYLVLFLAVVGPGCPPGRWAC